MTDAELREAVELLNDILETDCQVSSPEKFDALQKAIKLMTRYLELGGVVGEKGVGYVNPNLSDINKALEIAYEAEIYNKGRQDTLLAIAKRLEGLEDVIDKNSSTSVEEGCLIDREDLPQVAKVIRESILGKE